MIELLMIVSMGLGGVLFSLGGYKWKFLRRYVLPFALAFICLFAGKELWRCGVLWAGLTIAFHLPYGSKTPYWLKFIVSCTFVAPTIPLGFTIWQVITPIAFIGMFKTSNWKPLAGEFSWKVVEFIVGGLVGITVARLIS